MDLDEIHVIFMEAYLESLKQYRKEYEGTVNLANKMINFQKYLPFIMAFIGFIYGGVTNYFTFISNAAFYAAWMGLVGAIPVLLLSYLYWGIVRRVYNNKIVDIDENIECVVEAKKSMEKELELQKGISMDEVMEKYNQGLEIEIGFDSEEIDKPKKRVRKLNSRKKK